jgi:predicted nucleotidyltransferase
MKKKIKVEVIRYDNIDGFGAYVSGENIILMNIDALVVSDFEDEMPLKEGILYTLMHEFGHCLEEHLNLEFDEERVNKIINEYIDRYGEKRQYSPDKQA